MYDELYAAWRVEIESADLGSLSADFYARAGEYLRKIKEENRMLDKKSVKTSLLEHEMSNARRMVQEIVQARFRKISKKTLEGGKVPSEFLAAEEAKLCSDVAPSADAFNRFVQNLLQGQVTKVEAEAVVHKRVALRFIKAVPSIIGADMQTYGPFLVEDVASVPVENAKILVKQGLAKQVEIA